jgi:hypothetical protein
MKLLHELNIGVYSVVVRPVVNNTKKSTVKLIEIEDIVPSRVLNPLAVQFCYSLIQRYLRLQVLPYDAHEGGI